MFRNEMDYHHVFYGFNEAKINFNPTYKFDPGEPHTNYSEKRNRYLKFLRLFKIIF